MLTHRKESFDQPRQQIKKQRYYFANKGPSSQGYILLPCLFNLYAVYITRKTGLEEEQAAIKIAGRNINNLKYAVTPPLWQKVKKNKKPLDESERGE